MEIPGDAFILCHACNSKNGSDATHCSQCNADLLPGRTTGARLGFAALGLFGLGLIPLLLLWWGDAPWMSIWIMMIPVIMMGAGFTLALSTQLERLGRRADRHMTVCPSQAV